MPLAKAKCFRKSNNEMRSSENHHFQLLLLLQAAMSFDGGTAEWPPVTQKYT